LFGWLVVWLVGWLLDPSITLESNSIKFDHPGDGGNVFLQNIATHLLHDVKTQKMIII
jgi:hypothetical protein